MLATGWYSQRLLSRDVLGLVLGGTVLTMLPYLPGTPVKIALTTLGVTLSSVIFVISNAVVGKM
jgi:hypothetical protein